MASVVDTSVKHFHSGMAGAPVLSGVAGALIAMLDACLVNGFDVKAGTSLVVAAGVATLPFAGTHSATVDSVILLSGASVGVLNGEQKITDKGAGFVKFATAAADGAATGSLSFKMAPVGMASPFTGTNLRTYKSMDPASTAMILRVDDTGTYQARVVGYEQMSDINTGTGAFPMPATIAGGGLWAKSIANDASPVPWSIFADGRLFFINICWEGAWYPQYIGHTSRGFGDITPSRPGGDPYACLLNCHLDPTAQPAVAAMNGNFASGSGYNYCRFPRQYTGLGSEVGYEAYGYLGNGGHSGVDAFMGAFPSKIDGSLMLSAKYLAQSREAANGASRGVLPGQYHCPQSGVASSFSTLSVLPGTGALAGRKLMAVNTVTNINQGAGSALIGTLFFDITGPWR